MARRFYTSRKRAYRAHRDALADRFAAAHDFLRGLEVLCEGDHGFHMGTAKHVQMYLGDRFLFHLAIRDAQQDAPWLELSPRHHGQLKSGTIAAPHLLFRDRIHRVLEQVDVPSTAVVRRDDAYRMGHKTPLIFFRLLQAELIDLLGSGDFRPSQQELFGEQKPRRRRRKRRKKDPDDELIALADDAEEAVASVVRGLEARLGAAVVVRMDAEGAEVKLAGEDDAPPRIHAAETLKEAVAAAIFEVLGG